MQLIHGGDWAGYEREYGAMPLDFSASISPLGLPEGVRQAAAEALTLADRYPDPLCRTLRHALAQRYGVGAERIVCGNGAADLIYRLVLAKHPCKALITAPTFSEYERALETVNCETIHFYLREVNCFDVTPEILALITPELDMLVLCEPNNPTGRRTEPELLRRILRACAEQGTLVMVDECFADFLDKPSEYTLVSELDRYPNLVILKAFTKWFAMAGLRLGYALCGSKTVAEALQRCGQPWPVSTPAQAAGLAALGERDYDDRLHCLIQEQRPRLKTALAELGCKVVPGEANYLLFYHEDELLGRKLRERGILLRDCGNYKGLGPGWYRTAVRTAEENGMLLKTLREVL